MNKLLTALIVSAFALAGLPAQAASHTGAAPAASAPAKAKKAKAAKSSKKAKAEKPAASASNPK
ncbi:MAG: hypothetical protein LCI02_02075 [Proteobacteria bacterium]|nr:hypothetical protein [Pseudomonadota bacterium]